MITNSVDECQALDTDVGAIEVKWSSMEGESHLPFWIQNLNKTELKTETIIPESVSPVRTVLFIRDRQENTL